MRTILLSEANVILDYRTCIMLEVYDENKKLASSQVFSATLVDNLANMKKVIEDKLPGFECKFLTINKKLNNELLTIIDTKYATFI